VAALAPTHDGGHAPPALEMQAALSTGIDLPRWGPANHTPRTSVGRFYMSAGMLRQGFAEPTRSRFHADVLGTAFMC
jgi:hypothetical protein